MHNIITQTGYSLDDVEESLLLKIGLGGDAK
jgi:hypothetical protein